MNRIGKRTLICMAVIVVAATLLTWLLPHGCEPGAVGAAMKLGGER